MKKISILTLILSFLIATVGASIELIKISIREFLLPIPKEKIGNSEFLKAFSGLLPSVGIPSVANITPANLFSFCKIYSATFPIFVDSPLPFNLFLRGDTFESKE